MTINSKSLSNNAFWDQKPIWCQPWSIITTGILIIGISLFWPARLWFSIILSILIFFWWLLFLILAPMSYRDQLEN